MVKTWKKYARMSFEKFFFVHKIDKHCRAETSLTPHSLCSQYELFVLTWRMVDSYLGGFHKREAFPFPERLIMNASWSGKKFFKIFEIIFWLSFYRVFRFGFAGRRQMDILKVNFCDFNFTFLNVINFISKL